MLDKEDNLHYDDPTLLCLLIEGPLLAKITHCAFNSTKYEYRAAELWFSLLSQQMTPLASHQNDLLAEFYFRPLGCSRYAAVNTMLTYHHL